MAFRDQLVRCGACGKDFVYTVREQRKRAEKGLSTDPPAFCADCRGADVRLAEAVDTVPDEVDETTAPQRPTSQRPTPQQPTAPAPAARNATDDRRTGEGDDNRNGSSRSTQPRDSSQPKESDRSRGGGRGRRESGGSRTGGGGRGRSDRRGQGSRGGRSKSGGKGRGGGGGGRGRKAPSTQTELRIRHIGTVKWFNTQKGYGFIAQEEGGEVFVHLSGVLDDAVQELEIGTPVEFEIEHTPRGPQAVDVIQLA